jgi:hypothetical protein
VAALTSAIISARPCTLFPLVPLLDMICFDAICRFSNPSRAAFRGLFNRASTKIADEALPLLVAASAQVTAQKAVS